MKSAIIEAAEYIEGHARYLRGHAWTTGHDGVLEAERLAQRLRAEASGWQPIETAPKDRSVLLFWRGSMFCGRLREGVLGEPSQHLIVWRSDCSGRYCHPTHWMPLPAPPAVNQSLTAEKSSVIRAPQRGGG